MPADVVTYSKQITASSVQNVRGAAGGCDKDEARTDTVHSGWMEEHGGEWRQSGVIASLWGPSLARELLSRQVQCPIDTLLLSVYRNQVGTSRPSSSC